MNSPLGIEAEGEEFLREEDMEAEASDSKLKVQMSDLRIEIEPFGAKVEIEGLGASDKGPALIARNRHTHH